MITNLTDALIIIDELRTKNKRLEGELATLESNALKRYEQLQDRLNQAKAEIIILEKAKHLSCAEHGHDRHLHYCKDLSDGTRTKKLGNFDELEDIDV